MAYESKTGQVTTANTNRDGTGTLATIYTVTEVGGIKLDAVRIVATGNTTDGMVRLFNDRSGVVRMVAEIPVSAVTVSPTVPAFNRTIVPISLYLQNGDILKASTENTETFNVSISYVS